MLTVIRDVDIGEAVTHDRMSVGGMSVGAYHVEHVLAYCQIHGTTIWIYAHHQ